MTSNYILLIDEHGEPYLAHAWGDRQDHKYKLKVPNYYGNGKHLYLYTDAEVRAFQKRGKVRWSAKIKDKLGWDERSERDEAEQKYKRMTENGQGSQTQRDAVLQERNQKQEAYSKTALGRLENLRKRHDNDPMGLVRSQTKTEAEKQNTGSKNVRSENRYVVGRKINRWLEQNVSEPLQKKTQEVSEKVQKKGKEAIDKVTQKANDVYNEGVRIANYPKQAEEERKKEAEVQKSKAERVSQTRPRNVTDSGQITQKVHYGEYDKNDPDFDDYHYDHANTVGNTDFLTYQRDDGRHVILEEDMKWVLPKGISANDPKIKKVIENFSDEVLSARATDDSAYTGQKWVDTINKALNDAVKDIQESNAQPANIIFEDDKKKKTR